MKAPKTPQTLLARCPDTVLEEPSSIQLVNFNLVVSAALDTNLYFGISMWFPFGNTEATGFGAVFAPHPDTNQDVALVSHRRLDIVLPRGGYTMDIVDKTDCADAPKSLRNAGIKKLNLVRFQLKEGQDAQVRGWGLPFENRGEAYHDWLLNQAPVLGSLSLLDLVSQRSFTLFVFENGGVGKLAYLLDEKRLPKPFDYGYGTDHSWDLERYHQQLENCCHLDQHAAANYFVRKDEKVVFAVVRRSDVFVAEFADSWTRLANDGYVTLHLHKNFESLSEAGIKLKAKILSNAERIPALKGHVDTGKNGKAKSNKYENDLFLSVLVAQLESSEKSALVFFEDCAKAKAAYENCVSFAFNSPIKEAERHVGAVNQLSPHVPDSFEIRLVRDLFCGRGFFKTLTKDPNHRYLPVIDYLDGLDCTVAAAIVSEALPDDRQRFEAHLRNRALGICLIAAPGGTGKTTVLSAVTLAMLHNPRIGTVYGSGPTHVAVSKFAERLYTRGAAVAAKCNAGKVGNGDEETRIRRPVVEEEDYLTFKDKAKGIALDEAACLTRADLLSVYGNGLRPLAMAGDVMQLTPAMMDKRNRFYLEGKVSALAFYQGTGLPVYRLWTQLRMCDDQFGLARKLVYKDLTNFKLLNVQKAPDLRSSAAGTLQPVFVHCPGTKTHSVGTSKRNPAQVCLALELLSFFVRDKQVNPANIVIICPYRPNVELANGQLARFPDLKGMAPAQTADSFQDKEGDMAVVIFGTTEKSEAGFTSAENRLNVMITRQKSALVLVGDKNVTGLLPGDSDKKLVAKAEKAAITGIRSFGVEGAMVYSRARLLREVLKHLQDLGRIFAVGKEPPSQPEIEAMLEEVEEVGGGKRGRGKGWQKGKGRGRG
ncbi:P-loop containing nucleoside triphosphate hydrolase protein [Podospora fimiseda]|uniref:P-loop containing nucleoside triphosphate hydrolase protein n=1 Tax=Podospora fimiseda TaxID=252190 RepID=A0AAN6YMI9_9PEZI|nr:P-loop containing nucleoside triphosphate hydrolase protein [Podospora fimiseda]